MSDFNVHQFPPRKPVLNVANARWHDGLEPYEDEEARRRRERQERAVDRAMWCLLAAGFLALPLMVTATVYVIGAAFSALPVAFWIGLGLFVLAVIGLAVNIWLGDDG